jgi:hypothetical protein
VPASTSSCRRNPNSDTAPRTTVSGLVHRTGMHRESEHADQAATAGKRERARKTGPSLYLRDMSDAQDGSPRTPSVGLATTAPYDYVRTV